MAWLPNDQVLTARGVLQALMARFPFASCTPFANQTTPPSGSDT